MPALKSRFFGVAFVTPLLLLGATVCHAQTLPDATPTQEAPEKAKKRRLPLIGPELEAFRFFSSKTRARFGSTTYDLSPGLGDVTPSLEGKVGLDLSVTLADKKQDGDKNKLFLIFVGPEYRRAYIPPQARRAIREAQEAAADTKANSTEGISPAAATSNTSAAGGLSGHDFGPPPFLPYYGASLDAIYAKVQSPADSVDSSGLGVGGSLFAGVAIKRRAFIEARVRATTQVKDFDFSGIGLKLGLRF